MRMRLTGALLCLLLGALTGCTSLQNTEQGVRIIHLAPAQDG